MNPTQKPIKVNLKESNFEETNGGEDKKNNLNNRNTIASNTNNDKIDFVDKEYLENRLQTFEMNINQKFDQIMNLINNINTTVSSLRQPNNTAGNGQSDGKKEPDIKHKDGE